ncbi:hypothetical protein D3C78_861810 [compost metagenome]
MCEALSPFFWLLPAVLLPVPAAQDQFDPFCMASIYRMTHLGKYHTDPTMSLTLLLTAAYQQGSNLPPALRHMAPGHPVIQQYQFLGAVDLQHRPALSSYLSKC